MSTASGHARRLPWRTQKEMDMANYVLAALVALLVIYLFYAVIHPERF